MTAKINPTVMQIGGSRSNFRISRHGRAFRPAGTRTLSQADILTTGGFTRTNSFLERLTSSLLLWLKLYKKQGKQRKMEIACALPPFILLRDYFQA